MPTYHTTSEQETEALAERLAGTLRGGDVVAFRGGLGAGKTAFTRGLGRGLGVTDPVSSPTFAIANAYRGGRLLLVHFDMYRVETPEALEATGYYDFMEERDDVVYAVEWGERVEGALPGDAITVTLRITGESSRAITIEGGDAP